MMGGSDESNDVHGEKYNDVDPLECLEQNDDNQDNNKTRSIQDYNKFLKNHLNKLKTTKISDVQLPLLLVFVFSTILLIAVTTWEGAIQLYGYAASIPSVSFILSLIGLLVASLREELYMIYGKYLAHVLFLWNLVGSSYLTFTSPFITTGNGYFAAWATVAASAMAMGVSAEAFKDKIKGLGSLMGLLTSSIILIVASIEYLSAQVFRGAAIYALVLSCFTIILVLGIMTIKKKSWDTDGSIKHYEYNKFIILCIFSFLWLVCACHVTFHGPFVTTGNGYFSVWAGFGCILCYAYNAKKEIDTTVLETVNHALPGVQPTGLSSNM